MREGSASSVSAAFASAPDYGGVLDALAVGVVVHAPSLRIVYTNGTAAALLGVEVADAVTRDVADPRWVVIHPDGTAVSPDEVPASVALATRQPVRGMILGVKQPDGVTTWLTVDGVPLLDERGNVEFVAVTISDITRDLVARMQLERESDLLGRTVAERDAALARAVEALDSSEARYRAVLRAMSEGVAVHSVDGGILFANPAAQRILGLTVEQMQGRHPVDPQWRLTDAQGGPLPPECIPSEITRRTGAPQRNVVLGVQRGGSGAHAWLSVSTDPIGPATEVKKEGRFSVVATFTDITAERNALAEARHARDHLRDIAAALPGVVMEYLVTKHGELRFSYVSEPAELYFGVLPETIIRDSAAVLGSVHIDDRDELLARLRGPTDSGVQADFRVVNPDGNIRYLRLGAGPPTLVPDGVLVRSVALDVTGQRILEERVREAQRREAIGTLAAGMAHNFNNMLAVIVPSLEMARSEAPADIAQELDDACSAAHAASELVRQLMQLVRRGAAGAMVQVDVSTLLMEVSQLCRRTFDASIDVRCSTPAEPCIVLARRAELQQVLVNMCINARDALESRPAPRLELRASREGEQIAIEVSDNGLGMSTEVQRHLGEPFFTTKAPGRGTGLGLATAFGIVSELRGTLECHSTLGVGTRFVLRLPCQAALDGARPSKKPEAIRSAEVKVLLIDDEALVRSTLTRALERASAQVLCAADGEKGLELLRQHSDVGMVLLDLAMPGLNGTEVLRRLREFNRDVPVYLITGFVPEALDTSGFDGVLTKPLDFDRVRALLAKHARQPDA